MATIDLHSKPFDETTTAKLEIFEDYAQAWIPTFVMQGRPEIHIFDFFAGTGFDQNGIKGSPIRILDKIYEQIVNVFQKRVKVVVHFNEFQPTKKNQEKFELLQTSCANYLNEKSALKRAIDVRLYNEDAEILFPKLFPLIESFPSLVYLDQNGIKFLSDQYFLKLEKCVETDFLYFVSSSYFWRFGNHEAFKTHFQIDIEEAKKDPYKFIHKSILRELRTKISSGSKLRLYPYSLKKGSNIHGIIFGASHPRAVDKFLSIAWKRNTINGEANFDIDDDTSKAQMDLFKPQRTKIQIFKDKVKEKLLSGNLKDNGDLYDYALDNGHISKHAADAAKELKKEKKITYEGKSPLVTYENVYKNNKFVEYKILNNE